MKSLSRRGLFGVLAASPVAAVAAVGSTSAEPAVSIGKLVIEVDTSQIDIARSKWAALARAMSRNRYPCDGDWRL